MDPGPGAASAIVTPDPLDESIAARAELPIQVRLNAGDAIDRTLGIVGPAQINGFNRSQITRAEPA